MLEDDAVEFFQILAARLDHLFNGLTAVPALVPAGRQCDRQEKKGGQQQEGMRVQPPPMHRAGCSLVY